MNPLLKGDLIKERYCENNLSYILEDSSLFQTTEFKVLRHQQNSVFVDSCKMMLNGKVQIYYLTGILIPINEVIKETAQMELTDVLLEVYTSLLEIKKIGFLSLQNILTDTSHIYMEASTKKIKLIYLPIYGDAHKSEVACEKEVLREIRHSLMELVTENESQTLAELLKDDLSIEQTVARLKNRSVIEQRQRGQSDNDLHLRIQSRSSSSQKTLIVDKDEFMIGRKASVVDGVITSSKLIGRVHCKILRKGYSFSVLDLHSINGTFINGERILPNQAAALSDGDILRLADEEFVVTIGE